MKLMITQGLNLTLFNLKARYRNSVAGYLWVFFSPLLVFLAQAYMFRAVFKIEVANYMQFLLFGIGPWIFFSQTVDMCTGIFHHQAKLLKSFPLAPLSLIIAQAMDNFINALSVVTIAILVLGMRGEVMIEKVYLFPIPFMILFFATLGLSSLLAVVNVFFHDVKFITQFALGLLYFVTPIVYPENFVPPQYQFLVSLNPLSYLIRPFRSLADLGPSPEFAKDLVFASAVSILICLLSYYVWWRKRHDFYRRI